LNQPLVFSEDFLTVLPPGRQFTDFGVFQLKGKSQQVRVFGIKNDAP